MERHKLIMQLRHALYLAESPNEDPVEFEIGDSEFCFSFYNEEDNLAEQK